MVVSVVWNVRIEISSLCREDNFVSRKFGNLFIIVSYFLVICARIKFSQMELLFSVIVDLNDVQKGQIYKSNVKNMIPKRRKGVIMIISVYHLE